MTHNELYAIFSEYNIRNYCRGTHIPRNSMIKCHLLPMVLNVDEVRETLTLQAETGKAIIDFEDILDIDPQNPSLFDDAPDEVW